MVDLSYFYSYKIKCSLYKYRSLCMICSCNRAVKIWSITRSLYTRSRHCATCCRIANIAKVTRRTIVSRISGWPYSILPFRSTHFVNYELLRVAFFCNLQRRSNMHRWRKCIIRRLRHVYIVIWVNWKLRSKNASSCPNCTISNHLINVHIRLSAWTRFPYSKLAVIIKFFRRLLRQLS